MDARTDLGGHHDTVALLAPLLDPSFDPLLWRQPPVTRDSACTAMFRLPIGQ
jgi:hypothetical protein